MSEDYLLTNFCMLPPLSIFAPMIEDDEMAATQMETEDTRILRKRLFQAIKNHESLATIKLLTIDHPPLVTMIDRKEGMTPLHLACMHSASPDVVAYLLQIFPKSLTMVDRYDFYPLHIALKYKAHVDVIRMLVWHYPESCRMTNFLGCTALHCACSYGSTPDSVQLLIEAYPSAVTLVNRVEETPLHCACKAYGTPLESVHLLIQANPKMITALDLRGNTPFHCSCEWEAPLEMLKLLHQNCPPSQLNRIFMPNKDGNTPLHLVCKYNEVLDAAFVQYLTHLWPASCLILNNVGRCPWEEAVASQLLPERHVSGDILRSLRKATREATRALVDASQSIPPTLPKSTVRHISELLQVHATSKWGLDGAVALLNNNELQALLIQERYQLLINGIIEMNRAGRAYIRDDPGNKEASIAVLSAVSDNHVCIYQHLREAPCLCER